MRKHTFIIIIILFILITFDITTFNNFKQKVDLMNATYYEHLTKYTDYNFDLLSNKSFLTYEDSNYYSIPGIDVSVHQGKIDWKKVKDAGIKFAFIRIGYRGSIGGVLYKDGKFEDNYTNAMNNGIQVGVYWYSQAKNTKEAVDEANFVLNILGNRHLDLPIVYDYEETFFANGTFARIHGLSKEEKTQNALAFIRQIDNNNYDHMIYTNLSWADSSYDWIQLKGNPVWFAQYSSQPQFILPFEIWQYSDSGNVDGIDCDVDLDIMFRRKNNRN